MSKLRIGELLKSKGLVTEEQTRVAMSQQAVTGALMGDTLVNLGFVSSRDIAQALSEQEGLEFIDLEYYPVSEEALKLFPREVAEGNSFLPLSVKDGVVSIGITSPTNLRAMDIVRRVTGKKAAVYMVDTESYYEKLEKTYYFLENPIHKRIGELAKEAMTGESVAGATIAGLAELLIKDGIRRSATDVHITPAEDSVHVLYRVDGVLQHTYCLPKSIQAGVVSRIKILSELDIAEQRLPQDGSFTFEFLNKDYEMRVSFVPTIHGENVVVRILGGVRALRGLTDLGFFGDEVAKLERIFKKPYGIILVAGPTGSGKTTTLYSALKNVNLLQRNVLTVEDPVEYKLSFVKQTRVMEKAGYDFARAGRSFMRQDPDVMLIGEIRDEESSRMAVRASITGHLVLSTIHTNDAASTIPRLVDLNTDRFLLSSTLLAVVAQRLVRMVCGSCREEYTPEEEEIKLLGLERGDLEGGTFYRGRGCKHCSHTGYIGRVAIGEVLLVDDEIKEHIYSGASVYAINEAAKRAGMRSLKENGIKKAFEGVTTFEEVLRVVG